MAIGVRRDMSNVMPGTQALRADVATGIVKGQFVKITAADGKIDPAAGIADSGATAPEYLVVSQHTSGVTADKSVTTYDVAALPVMGNKLTYITQAYESTLGVATGWGPLAGQLMRLNVADEPASGDLAGTYLIEDADADHNTDAQVVNVLEVAASASGAAATVEFRLL